MAGSSHSGDVARACYRLLPSTAMLVWEGMAGPVLGGFAFFTDPVAPIPSGHGVCLILEERQQGNNNKNTNKRHPFLAIDRRGLLLYHTVQSLLASLF